MSKNVCLPVEFFTLFRKAQDHITHLPQLKIRSTARLPRKKKGQAIFSSTIQFTPSEYQHRYECFYIHVHTTLLPYRSTRVKHLQDAITPFTLYINLLAFPVWQHFPTHDQLLNGWPHNVDATCFAFIEPTFEVSLRVHGANVDLSNVNQTLMT